MDVRRLTTGTAMENKDVLRGRGGKNGKTPAGTLRIPALPEPDKTDVKVALDKIIRNTRFQYDIKDEPGYFVVRIIDRDTDEVIREIPSKELQKVRKGIEQVLGVLFDEVI